MVLLNLIPRGFYHGTRRGRKYHSFLASHKKKMSSDLLVEESVCQWFDCGKQLPPVSDLCLVGGCLQKVQLS